MSLLATEIDTKGRAARSDKVIERLSDMACILAMLSVDLPEADISHWCNVHESLLEDQTETVAMALERVEHLHARIGHQEGPQVNDPRAPEWENAVKAHLAWWDKVLERKMQAGETMTILTEFGPPNYLPTLPYTQQPVADQWAINVYIMQMLRKRYLR